MLLRETIMDKSVGTLLRVSIKTPPLPLVQCWNMSFWLNGAGRGQHWPVGWGELFRWSKVFQLSIKEKHFFNSANLAQMWFIEVSKLSGCANYFCPGLSESFVKKIIWFQFFGYNFLLGKDIVIKFGENMGIMNSHWYTNSQYYA